MFLIAYKLLLSFESWTHLERCCIFVLILSIRRTLIRVAVPSFFDKPIRYSCC